MNAMFPVGCGVLINISGLAGEKGHLTFGWERNGISRDRFLVASSDFQLNDFHTGGDEKLIYGYPPPNTLLILHWNSSFWQIIGSSQNVKIGLG